MESKYAHDDLKNALEVLKSGGIILYPTDTVWGLGCDATNADAVAKIYKLKGRPTTKQMLVLIDSPARLSAYLREVPPLAWDLTDLSTKPLTIIYPGARNIAQALISPEGNIGIRVTQELFSQALCARLRKPVVSTSANLSNKPTPRIFSEIEKVIINGVDYVVQYRQNDDQVHNPSGIIQLGLSGEIKIIRE